MLDNDRIGSRGICSFADAISEAKWLRKSSSENEVGCPIGKLRKGRAGIRGFRELLQDPGNEMVLFRLFKRRHFARTVRSIGLKGGCRRSQVSIAT